MKKHVPFQDYAFYIMKVGLVPILIITAFTSMVNATTLKGQEILEAKISINAKNQAISEILLEIEKQASCSFTYQGAEINSDKRVSISVRNEDLKSVLKKLFDGDVSYEVLGNDIVLTPSKRTSGDNRDARGKAGSSASGAPVDAGAQTALATVSGTVSDAQGNPIPGTNILVKGTTIGTTTDSEGRYALEVLQEDAVLVFSFIGYTTQEIALNGRSVIDVVLMADVTNLEEVVVVGYGSVKKSDLTGAISSVSSENLQDIPASNFLEKAQGQLAGVDIVRSNGAPGSDFQIRIRGNRSIRASNEPLYVIDGIPTSQGLSDFNPNDIESMEVLKDASAVAIYGSRGANGVILITTKKGKKGKAEVNYYGYYGVKKAIEDIQPMNGQEFVEYFRITRGLSPDDNSQDDRLLATEEYNNYINGISTNYLDHILRDGRQQEHLISASGSGESITYYISGGYFNEQGLMRKSDYSRYSVRTNVEARLNPKTRVGIAGTVSSFVNNIMPTSPISSAISFTPLTTPYDAEGNFLPYPGTREFVKSPLLNFQPGQYENERKGYRVFNNIYGEYEIAKDLKYRLNFGIDYSNSRHGEYSGTLAGESSTASMQNQLDFSYTLENIVSWDKTINEHGISLVGLFSTQKKQI